MKPPMTAISNLKLLARHDQLQFFKAGNMACARTGDT
jgi:hypothetical protein